MFRALLSLLPNNNALTNSLPQPLKMRLRLRIERNSLPPTLTLWPITNDRQTIAQLLQNLNDTFPLEADTWGLEDYAVSVSGYDCLHYHELRAVCKDDDEVVIRPLQWEDVRARKLTGRDQIAADGRHLVDGIPFGRPKVKDPVRPDVRIPPRKRRKLSHEEEVIVEDEVEDASEEEEDDEDFDVGSAEEDASSSGSSSEESDNESSSDDDSSSEASDSTSSSDSSSDAESWNGLSPKKPASLQKKEKHSLPNGTAKSSQTPKEATASSKRKRESEDDEAPNPVVAPSAQNLPFKGSAATKLRNLRRKQSGQLKRLKEAGKLPADATVAMMREMLAEGVEANNDVVTVPHPLPEESDASVVMQAVPEQDAPAEHQTAATNPPKKKGKKRKLSPETEYRKEMAERIDYSDNEEFQRLRQKLLNDIEAGGIDVTRREDKLAMIPQPSVGKRATGDNVAPEAALSTTPRSRLNLAASARLVFGSLGLRTPKTAEEKEATQKKLAQRGQRAAFNAPSPSATASPPTTGDANTIANSTDSLINGTSIPRVNGQNFQTGIEVNEVAEQADDKSHWSSKINLTALECCEENVTLSRPPFPFHQRWDPQQRKKKNKRGNAVFMETRAGKKRKQGYQETYDKYNIIGGDDFLQYDDVEYEEEEYWEDGALLDGEEELGDEDDIFPPLPADPSQLPPLSEEEAQEKDFIIWDELACDESTNWQPKMITRAAQIVSLHEDWPENKSSVLTMSNRDQPRKVYDEEGNRVYGKFEMPDEDGEEDGESEKDPGLRTVEWSDLGVVRLLLREDGNGEDSQ